MSGPVISARIEEATLARVLRFALTKGISKSEAIRIVLEAGIPPAEGLPEPWWIGYHEGRNIGRREALSKTMHHVRQATEEAVG